MSQHGNEWVASLAERHGRMAFGAAYRVLGSAEDAEDVLQEVFVKLLDGKVDPETPRHWGAYLRTMAVNGAIARRRRRGPILVAMEESALEFAAGGGNGHHPRDIAALKQKAGMLLDAMDTLDQRDAELFALRHFEDLTHEQIAEQTGLRSGTVRTALHRARKRLQAILLRAETPPGEATNHVERAKYSTR